MPYHDFLLLSEQIDPQQNYQNFLRSPNALRVDDDLILYIMDSLKWIPSSNPSNPKPWIGYGLNYYGPTVISRRGADQAKRVFLAWRDLFCIAPNIVRLTGSFTWENSSGPEESGEYSKLQFDRSVITDQFGQLASWAQTASNGTHYLLHIGI